MITCVFPIHGSAFVAPAQVPMQVVSGTCVEDFRLMKSVVPTKPVIEALDEMMQPISLAPPDDDGQEEQSEEAPEDAEASDPLPPPSMVPTKAVMPEETAEGRNNMY